MIYKIELFIDMIILKYDEHHALHPINAVPW